MHRRRKHGPARRGAGDYMRALAKGIPILVLGAVIGGLAAYLVFGLLISPRYSSETTVYLSEQTGESEHVGAETAAGAVVIGVKEGEDAADAVLIPAKEGARVVKSREVAEDVISRLDLKVGDSHMAAERFLKMVTAEANADGHTLTIRVTDTNPARAADIANVLRETAAGYIGSIPGIGQMQLLSAAEPQEKSSDVNLVRHIVTGCACGFAAALVLVTILFLGDDRIRSGRDAERLLQIEVIARIPYAQSEIIMTKKRRHTGKTEKRRRKGESRR